MHRRKPLLWASLCAFLAAGLGIPARGAAAHYANPFTGTSWYVNPDYTQLANLTASLYPYPESAAMETAGRQPTAVWLDSIQAVDTMRTHLDRALAAGNNLIVFVVYDLPGRDCAAKASNGELPATKAGLTRYMREYINPIADVAHDSRYAGIRMVFIVEPDSLPNLVTNVNDQNPVCQKVASLNLYKKGVQHAVNRLVTRDRTTRYDNVYIYLDIAHSAWLGFDESMPKMVKLLGDVALGFTWGVVVVDGFVSNVSNYQPLEEPFMDADTIPPGISAKVANAQFYGSLMIDELSYVKKMWELLTASRAGGTPREPFPKSIGMLIDTSRNGWGGSGRPEGPAEGATTIDDFVAGTKVDRREHRGLWCNQSGAGLGERPQPADRSWRTELLDAHLSALLWVKPPGASDGSSDMGASSGGKNPDPNCDPEHMITIGDWTGNPNAMWNAPIAGEWFPDQFAMLIRNAYPPLF